MSATPYRTRAELPDYSDPPVVLTIGQRWDRAFWPRFTLAAGFYVAGWLFHEECLTWIGFFVIPLPMSKERA